MIALAGLIVNSLNHDVIVDRHEVEVQRRNLRFITGSVLKKIDR